MKRVMGYEVDGKIYYSKAEAEGAQARLNLAEFFGGPDHNGPEVAKSIFDNLDAFAEIIRPLIRKPRTAKAEVQADEYEAAIAGPKKGKAA